jgi:hypothetical protein
MTISSLSTRGRGRSDHVLWENSNHQSLKWEHFWPIRICINWNASFSHPNQSAHSIQRIRNSLVENAQPQEVNVLSLLLLLVYLCSSSHSPCHYPIHPQVRNNQVPTTMTFTTTPFSLSSPPLLAICLTVTACVLAIAMTFMLRRPSATRTVDLAPRPTVPQEVTACNETFEQDSETFEQESETFEQESETSEEPQTTEKAETEAVNGAVPEQLQEDEMLDASDVGDVSDEPISEPTDLSAATTDASEDDNDNDDDEHDAQKSEVPTAEDNADGKCTKFTTTSTSFTLAPPLAFESSLIASIIASEQSSATPADKKQRRRRRPRSRKATTDGTTSSPSKPTRMRRVRAQHAKRTAAVQAPAVLTM